MIKVTDELRKVFSFFIFPKNNRLRPPVQYLVITICSVFGLIIIGIYYFRSMPDVNWQISEQQIIQTKTRNLDGKRCSLAKCGLKPFGVMVENHFESRPQAGLEKASVIYETIVEGDITRFLAIFDGSASTDKIGPVRSVRPFFIELAKEYDLLLLHAGGSPDALDILRNDDLINVNEISADGIYFWRDKNRPAPHNLFTDSTEVARAREAKNQNSIGDFLPWKFGQPKSESSEVLEVEVDFGGSDLYLVKYQYSTSSQNYLRYINGEKHKTENGIVLTANNIIVQHVKSKIIDDYGRIEMNLTAGGKAEVYSAKTAVYGRWEKKDGRTRYYDQDGNEVVLAPGTTWVELLFY